MAAKYTDQSSKLSTALSFIERKVTRDIAWCRGCVHTSDGIVFVHTSEPKCTIMDFAHNGRRYQRRWQRGFWPTYLVTLARRFAADVVAQDTNDE